MTMESMPHGKVTGRLLVNAQDGADEGWKPDYPAPAGWVEFRARPERILIPDEKVIYHPIVFIVPLDQYGYLSWQGKRWIELPVPSEDTNPVSWTWTVTPVLRYDETPVPSSPFEIEVGPYTPGPDPENPDVGSTGLVDLSEAASVEGDAGTFITRGPKGDSISDITLSGDGSALVFHIVRVTGTDMESVTIPALGDLSSAVGVAEGARDDALDYRDAASGFASSASSSATAAGSSATAAAASAVEAAGYVGGVADNAISTVKVQNLAVTLPKLATTVQTSIGKADTAVQPAALTAKADLSLRGAVNGLASLDGTTKVPYAQMPTGTSASTVAAGDDTRLTNQRTPSDSSVTDAKVAVGAAIAPAKIAGTAVVTADARLSDTRTPTDGTVTNAKVPVGANLDPTKLGTGRVVGSNNGTPTSLTLWVGTAAQYAAIGTKDANTFYGVV